ncbi:hypothetical protein QN363_12085 [Undibacterium sp. CCC2.1]|uniref:hypothetical protein n=2 Tax=unclassified Undibacterium TaxID=2630295 RepID=UPI002B23E0CD|nr:MULTISPECIES: hypothetical protein [unclassified Undibacterium]MEB0139763.1 hypothetical protein [Undibacterium sp. CCC2.1]MEB0172644.1 hypothetical protein [Undibacterium sp. CCC1.1]MEB0176375.1 hypothetical protein [Undibacterium sp. CCC3.4]
MMFHIKQVMAALLCSAGAFSAYAAEPKIAVTDLTYEEKVSEYFHVVAATSKSSVKGSYSERETDRSYSQRGNINAKSESSYYEAEGTYTYIDRGELKNYTADLKGAMLKGGGVRITEVRPYVGKPMEKIYDIIGRIKQGMYPGADYVLFGTVSSIQFRQETNQLQYGNSMTASLSLDLVADFNLINTKTFEIKAAFSASGAGVDTKIISRAGDHVTFNRGKVIQETSRSLADAAYGELMVQFGVPRGANRASYQNNNNNGQMIAPPAVSEPVTVYH